MNLDRIKNFSKVYSIIQGGLLSFMINTGRQGSPGKSSRIVAEDYLLGKADSRGNDERCFAGFRIPISGQTNERSSPKVFVQLFSTTLSMSCPDNHYGSARPRPRHRHL